VHIIRDYKNKICVIYLPKGVDCLYDRDLDGKRIIK
jgi:hypothetical protein